MSSDSETTSMNSKSFVFEKNNVDYTKYALEFLSDELYYVPYIQSYTTEQDVILFIRENGIISKCAKIDEDGDLIELETQAEFVSINDWVASYREENVGVDYILNNVYIGEDLVPLWKILVDVKEEEEVEENEEEDDEEEDHETKEYDLVNEYTKNQQYHFIQKYILLSVIGLYIIIGLAVITVVLLAH